MPPLVCELNESLIRDGDLDPANLMSWHPRLLDELHVFDMISSVTWGSADGRGLWLARYSDGEFYFDVKDDIESMVMNEWRLNDDGSLPEEPTNSFELELRSRPWYRIPVENGIGSWTNPYIWAGGDDTVKPTIGVSFGLPLYMDDGALIGVIDADFQLGDLDEFLHTIETGDGGLVILSTDDGLLLAASNDIPFNADDGSLKYLSTAEDAVIARMGVLVENTESNVDMNNTITINNRSYYMHMSPVGEKQGLDWQLVTVIPTNTFIGNIEAHFRQSMFLSIAAVIFVVIIASAMARWLPQPAEHSDCEAQTCRRRQAGYQGPAGNRQGIRQSRRRHQPDDIRSPRVPEREQFLQETRPQGQEHAGRDPGGLCRQAADRGDVDRKLLDDLVSQVASLTGVHDLLGKRGAEGLHLRELIDSCSSPISSHQRRLRRQAPWSSSSPLRPCAWPLSRTNWPTTRGSTRTLHRQRSDRDIMEHR